MSISHRATNAPIKKVMPAMEEAGGLVIDMEEELERSLYLLEVIGEAASWRYLSLVARTFISALLENSATGNI